MKKNAALLRFLAFLLLDHIFGVLRGEQPLRRGPLPRNSGTFLLLFWSQKRRISGQMPTIVRVPRRVGAPASRPTPLPTIIHVPPKKGNKKGPAGVRTARLRRERSLVQPAMCVTGIDFLTI